MTPIVLLHGWGMRPGVFEGLRAQLGAERAVHSLGLVRTPARAPCTLDALARRAAADAPARCIAVGWSLGAQVAVQWARNAPGQVEQLVLIAATPCFVQRDDWRCAMERRVFEQFAAALDDDAQATLRRFAALQAHGDRNRKRVTAHLISHLADAVEQGGLDETLGVLLHADLRGALPHIPQRALVIHGEHDALVPLAAAGYLARTLPNARLQVIAGAAHAPFVSDEAAVARALAERIDG